MGQQLESRRRAFVRSGILIFRLMGRNAAESRLLVESRSGAIDVLQKESWADIVVR